MSYHQPILYSFRRCPYAIRARMALAYAVIDCEHREIELKNKPPSMLAFSSKGTVPVLILANESDNKPIVIDESFDVMHWALQQSDRDNWFVQQKDSIKAEIEKLVDANDNAFKPLLDRYKYADRHPEPADYYRTQAEDFLSRLEALLSNNTYLLGEQMSLADVAIFPFIRQFAFVDKPWFDQSGYSKLQAWLNGFLESQLFETVMTKHPVWQDPEA